MARARRASRIDHRDLELLEAEPIGEQPAQPAQALGRHQHERAEPPARSRARRASEATRYSATSVLPTPASPSTTSEVSAGRSTARCCSGSSTTQRLRSARRSAVWRRPRARLLAVGADDRSSPISARSAAPTISQRSSTLPFVVARRRSRSRSGSPGPAPEERLGERRRAPVEHRRRRIGLGPVLLVLAFAPLGQHL